MISPTKPEDVDRVDYYSLDWDLKKVVCRNPENTDRVKRPLIDAGKADLKKVDL